MIYYFIKKSQLNKSKLQDHIWLQMNTVIYLDRVRMELLVLMETILIQIIYSFVYVLKVLVAKDVK